MNKDGFAVRGWLHGLVEGSCSIDEAEEVINKFIRIAHEKGVAKGRLEMLLGHNGEKCYEMDRNNGLSSLNSGNGQIDQSQIWEGLKHMSETCEWLEDDGGMWSCSKCDIAWEFTSDGPRENDINYCPKCGRKVVNTSYYRDWLLEDKA